VHLAAAIEKIAVIPRGPLDCGNAALFEGVAPLQDDELGNGFARSTRRTAANMPHA